MRILVWGFSNNLAGTEAVVSNYIGRINRIAFDVVSYEETPSYAPLFTGSNNLIVIPRKSSSPLRYQRALDSVFRKAAASYDGIWCNINSYANIDCLKLAEHYGIQTRIIHAHNSAPVGGARTKLLHKLNRRAALTLATERWACSQEAGKWFFGDLSYTLIPNAIDYTAYAYSDRMRADFRRALNLPDAKLLIGAMGRISEQKNHGWLIKLAEELLRARIDFKIVVFGDGEQKGALSSKIEAAGLNECLSIHKPTSNVRGALSAMDVYVIPSLFEGLPLSLLEAQANGLPCLASDAVSRDAAISDQCHFLSLNKVDDWVRAIQHARRFDFRADYPRACKYSLNHQAMRLEDLFYQTVKGNDAIE